MARRRGRSMAMVAAGLAAAGAPFVLGQQTAGAAESTATAEGSHTFVTFSGATITCTATLTATHDTDDPDQPVLRWTTSMRGPIDCFEVHTTTSASYKDVEGTTRTSTTRAFGLAEGDVEGAYTDTSVRTVFDFTDCDFRYPPGICILTLRATPK